MNKKLLIAFFTILCIISTQGFTYANSKIDSKAPSSISGYIDELDRIDNDIYILAKSILESKNNDDYPKFKRELNFIKDEVNSIRNNLSAYYNTINANNVVSRNILALQVGVDYFRVALEELSLLIEDSNNNNLDKYNILANYFYNKYSATETISWVKSQNI